MRYLVFFLTFPLHLWATPLQIVTDMKPTTALVEALAPADAHIYTILPPNADPHHFQLKPADAKAIEDADYIVYMSDGLTPWLPEIFDKLQLNASIIELADIQGVERIPFENEEHEEHEEDDGHDHGAYDPHLWLSLENLKTWTVVLSQEFKNLSNQSEFFDDLEEQLAKYVHEDSIHYIIDHAALAYFDKLMGADMLGMIYETESSSASARHVRDLETLVETENVTCVFQRMGTRKTLTEEFANDNHLPLVNYDQLGGDIDTSGMQFYTELYTNLARAYRACGDVVY